MLYEAGKPITNTHNCFVTTMQVDLYEPASLVKN